MIQIKTTSMMTPLDPFPPFITCIIPLHWSRMLCMRRLKADFTRHFLHRFATTNRRSLRFINNRCSVARSTFIGIFSVHNCSSYFPAIYSASSNNRFTYPVPLSYHTRILPFSHRRLVFTSRLRRRSEVRR